MEKQYPYEDIEELRQRQALRDGLVTADRFINRTYLIGLHEQEVVPLDGSLRNMSAIRLYRIEKFVYDKDENVNDKLISVYGALQSINSAAIMLIQGEGASVSIYLGIRSEYGAKTAGLVLRKGFEGNFPGSTLSALRNREISDVFEFSFGNTEVPEKNVATVTVVPSGRDEDKDRFVQGLEKFIDTMQGEKYSALMIASPISKTSLTERKKGYEQLYSALSPYQKLTLAYGENQSRSVSKSMSENFSRSVNNSISNTTGRNTGSNMSMSDGMNHGFNGSSFSSGKTTGSSMGWSSGKSWSEAISNGESETTGTGINTSDSNTEGDSKTLTVEYMDKTVDALLKKIDKQMDRMSACEAFGIWECAAYFSADDIQTAVVAANSYKALMLGEKTDVEDAFVNVWGREQSGKAGELLEYLKYGIHPVFRIPPEHGYDDQTVTPATHISGQEIPMLMGLPHSSVPGLPVISNAEFGRNVFVENPAADRRSIRLGRVHHMGKTEDTEVTLDLDSFTSHCFITGSTGSGKSNTTYCLLEKMLENNVPFLVIEPAKGEYKDAFGKVENINIFTTNPLIGQMLKLNPFRFDERIHVLEHLDRLIEIFNACWEMYAAMPAILKDACEKIYLEKGWDVLNSIYVGKGKPQYPTFKDLMRVLPQIINSSGYSSDTKGDYIGALVTRVTSLTNGISGQIFCDTYEIDDGTMFDQNTIVDLSRVGSTETKSLIMGILVLKLTEYRMAGADGSNRELRHVTVLEEAHNLLKKSQPGQAGGSLVAKSVEMICSSIAEMRTYGEGFIIVDQSPTSVDIAAIKNTNTKIIMRLPEQEDCEAVGSSVALEKEQNREISRLSTGIAIVMQNSWLEAVQTHIDRSSGIYEERIPPVSYCDIVHLRSVVAKELMDQYSVRRKIDTVKLHRIIDETNACIFKKKEIRCLIDASAARLRQRDAQFFCNMLMNLTGMNNLFSVMESGLKQDDLASVENWKQRYLSEAGNYVNLDRKETERLLKYLIVSKDDPSDPTQKYLDLYRTLYKKG